MAKQEPLQFEGPGLIPETDITNYNPRGVLTEEVEVPSTTINGNTVPGWQTQRDSEGKLHTEDEKPSLIHADKTQEWHRHGKLHRDNGPARIKPDGRIEFWRDGSFFIPSLPANKPNASTGSARPKKSKSRKKRRR